MKYFILAFLVIGGSAFADTNRRLNIEIDPMAPVSSVYENKNYKYNSTKWGINFDFNVTNNISTGPELWVGNFNFYGPNSPDEPTRREDFIYGEKQKLESSRLRWNVTYWEHALSMSGYYVETAYNWTDILSRSKRSIEIDDPTGEDNALPAGIQKMFLSAENEDTDIISDSRHGVSLGVGERWMWARDRISFTVGASWTFNFKRSISHEGKDPDARADYDDLIENIPESKLSVRPYPEANVTFGISI